MLAGYTMEVNSRYRFLSSHLLALEKDKVSQINKSLDHKVKKRTKALSLANSRLQKEMAERLKTQAQQLRLEKELNKRQKLEAIGTLAGGIAHDFNNILSAVIGYTKLAMEDTDPQERTKNQAQVIKAALRAKELTSQILTFSRQAEPMARPIKIRPVMEEALNLLKASIPASVTITTQLKSEAKVIADPTQIHRIIINLCTNSVQAMADHTGTLNIILDDLFLDAPKKSLAPGPYIRLSISDTGQGMSPQVMEKIFDPFFTTKAVDQGSGMGLSVVHGIVKQYRGSIRAYSEQGRGATFVVLLPQTDKKITKSIIPDPTPLGKNETILVLDDEIALTQMMEKALTATGYQVKPFCSPHKALAYVKANHIDLIITDFSMPEMNGVEFAKKVVAIGNVQNSVSRFRFPDLPQRQRK
ncbi:MAG: response regulator [Desulfobacter sp.]|nr:MAG: response regulator [Desulfobacter sp.]